MRVCSRRLELAWHVFALVLLTGAFVPLWRRMTLGGVDPAEGDPVQRIVLAVAYLGLPLLALRPKRAAAVARRGLLVWMLVGWVVLSTCWSVAPTITLRRGLAAVLGVVYGILLAVRYPPRDVVRMLGIALGIVVVASLVVALALPEWGVMIGKHAGAWQGVLIHKNFLGKVSVLAIAAFWVLSRERAGGRFLWIALALVAIATLVGSSSATSLVTALAVVVAYCALRVLVRLPRLLRPALASFGMAAVLPLVLNLPQHLEPVMGLLGRDLTLTGRIPLWQVLIPMAQARLWLGYGYGAFWLGESGPSAAVWAVTWTAAHAHNGYLDLWLEVGLIGAVLGIALVFLLLMRTARRAYRARMAAIPAFAFLFSLFFAAENAAESVLLESGLTRGIYWVMLSYVFFTSYGLTDSSQTEGEPPE
jgi:exopolysaccharide production protein ExoQ